MSKATTQTKRYEEEDDEEEKKEEGFCTKVIDLISNQVIVGRKNSSVHGNKSLKMKEVYGCKQLKRRNGKTISNTIH